METQQESLTYEKVWAMFQETDKKFQEMVAQSKETDRRFWETDRKMKALQNLFEGQWGRLVESLIEGDLINLLQNRNIDVNESYSRVKKKFEGKQYEIDILVANGSEIVAVEVKTTLKVKKVEHFINKLKIFKEVFPHYKERIVYGGMAFIREEESSAEFAERCGLFVIKGTGKSSSIINSDEFKPKIF